MRKIPQRHRQMFHFPSLRRRSPKGKINCPRPLLTRAKLSDKLNGKHVAKTPAAQEQTPGQQMLKLPVRVVDADGKPVANAKIIPWALRSSQGHGTWSENDKRGRRRTKGCRDGRGRKRYGPLSVLS